MRTLRQGSRGNDVMEIHSLLEKMGYNPGPIDGIFGLRTKEKVQQFQRDNVLPADGIIGPNTNNVISSINTIRKAISSSNRNKFPNIANSMTGAVGK